MRSHLSSAAPSTLELSFVEEPLGLTTEMGYGYAHLRFGQRLGPNNNFEIVKKLGWGSYASVWLAKDHQNDQYVALKVLSSNATALDARGILQEMEFTSSVTSFIRNCGHPTPYCVQFLSHFQHHDNVSQPGEDLTHLCLVLEVCISDVERIWAQLPNRVTPTSLVKKILRDVVHGLAQMHAVKCAHTDLKAGNIFCRLPSSETCEIIQTALQSDPFSLNPPEQSLKGKVQSAKSQPLAVPNLEQAMRATYVLGDLGHAQYMEAQTTPFISPELYRAPETIMLGPWDTSVDLWALGCFAYELLCAAPLLSAASHYSAGPFPYSSNTYKDAAVYLDVETGGFYRNPKMPEDYLRARFYHQAGRAGVAQHDMDGAFALIQQCLHLNPVDRLTVFHLLKPGSWLVESGPPDF
ncbi:kinase-like domain-containing protein [Flagelloscypha sp. PMI_526]|nr:kinase-like domain-containing protein [Flagelloscypha sp. PMI_526]